MNGPRWARTDYWHTLPKWKRSIAEDPELFILRYFPHKIEKFEDFHRTLIETAVTELRSLILFPAAHGKTTIVASLLPILELCRDPDIRMMGILKNEVDAAGIGQAIHAELLGNERLISDFGPFEPLPEENKPFAITKMSVAKRVRRDKQPTLVLIGSGSRSALGHRTDWTFCDDIIHDKNSATPDARAKIREWFMQGPETQGELADSRLTVVGTRFDPADLYAELMKQSNPETGARIYKTLEFDAIVDDADGKTLWPERWPYLRLLEKKATMGTLDFNKRFRNIAVDKSRMVFREEYVRGGYIGDDHYVGCLDEGYKVGDYDTTWRRYGGFDPAVGQTRSAKFCVHTALAVGSCRDHERCFWVIDSEREQMTLPQQVDTILGKHQQYNLGVSVVEANSFQGGLLQAIEQKMKDTGAAIRVEPHYTTRTNKPDPEIGVQSMAPYFERGWVHIPWGDAFSQRKMRHLVDELIQYPGQFTDSVMSFWFAWKKAQEDAPTFGGYNRLVERKSIYGKLRGGRNVIRNPYFDRPDQEASVA